MKISKIEGRIKIVKDGQMVEVINKFNFLSAWITEDGRHERIIKSIISMAKDAFSQRNELLTRVNQDNW